MTQLCKFFIMFFAIVTTMARVLKRHGHFPNPEKYHPLYSTIPQGCYGQKQLREILNARNSTVKYRPYTPEWCSESHFLVPKRFKENKVKTTRPPYRILAESNGPSSNDGFKVILKSDDPNANIEDAIMVARPLDTNGDVVHNNCGRFIPSPGVSLVCCSLTDKDVARFQGNGSFVEEAIFYWLPYEEVTEDFEGNFIFIATVGKNSHEYWTNITSNTITTASPGSLLLATIH